jgi:hypothetical protein
MTDAFDLQQRAIDRIAQRAQRGQLVEALGEVEIVGIVDRQFAPESVPFFEILLEMRPFVLDGEGSARRRP